MAGVKLKVRAEGIEDVEAALRRLVSAGQDLTPAMEDIGEYLVRTTRDRFQSEKAPDGTPWAPLSEATKARKRRNAGKILTLDGHLQRQLVYRASADRVEVGSSMIYGGVHQFGAVKGAFGSTSRGTPIPWGDIPARPFLGLSDADRDEVRHLLIEYIESALE